MALLMKAWGSEKIFAIAVWGPSVSFEPSASAATSEPMGAEKPVRIYGGQYTEPGRLLWKEIKEDRFSGIWGGGAAKVVLSAGWRWSTGKLLFLAKKCSDKVINRSLIRLNTPWHVVVLSSCASAKHSCQQGHASVSGTCCENNRRTVSLYNRPMKQCRQRILNYWLAASHYGWQIRDIKVM